MKKILCILLTVCLISAGAPALADTGTDVFTNVLLNESFDNNTDNRALNMFSDRSDTTKTYNNEGSVTIKSTNGSPTVNLSEADQLGDFRFTADITVSNDQGNGIIIRSLTNNTRDSGYFLQWYQNEFRVLKFVGGANQSTTGLTGTTSYAIAAADYANIKHSIKIEADGAKVTAWIAAYSQSGALDDYTKVIEFTDTGSVLSSGYLNFYVNGTDKSITLDNILIQTKADSQEPGGDEDEQPESPTMPEDNESAENLLYTADFSAGVPTELSKGVYGTPALSAANSLLTVGGTLWSATVLSDAKHVQLFPAAGTYDNYTIVAAVADTLGNMLPGVAFRGTDGNVYSVYVRNAPSGARAVANLMRVKNAAASGGTVINAYNGTGAANNETYMATYTTSTVIAPGTYYKVKVTVSGTTVKAWLGDDLILECSTQNGVSYQALEFNTGSVGIMNTTGGDTGRIGYFKVYSNGEEDDEPGNGGETPVPPADTDEPLPQYVAMGNILYENSFENGYNPSEDFIDAYKGASSAGAALSVSGGKLNITNNAMWDTKVLDDEKYAVISSPENSYDNYVISVDVTAADTADLPAIAFRATEGNAYGIYPRAAGEKTYFNLMKITGGTTSGGTIVDTKLMDEAYKETYTAGIFTPGESYKFTVVVKDNNVKAYWNEKLVMNYTGLAYAKGSIGVMTRYSGSSWDNLTVAETVEYGLSGFSVAGGATDVTADSELILSFSESTDAQTIKQFITVNDGEEDVDYFEVENTDSMAVKLTFTGGLEYNKTYTVTLAAGAPSANGVPTVTEYTTTFTTAKGKKLYVSDIAVAGNTATVSLSNLTTQLQSAVLVVCAYKADGEFAGVKYTDVTFTSGEEISPSVTFDSLEGVESVTAFLWESNSSLCPVEKGFTKNI